MNPRKSTNFFFLIFVISILFFLVLLSTIFFPFHTKKHAPGNLHIYMQILRSENRLTAMELAKAKVSIGTNNPTGVPGTIAQESPPVAFTREKSEPISPGKKVKINRRSAYLWVVLHNTEHHRRKVFFSTGARNSHTEFLAPTDLGAYTLSVHGEKIPLADSAISFRKASFPVEIDKNSTRCFIVELHDPLRILLFPQFFSPAEFYNHTSREQRYTGLAYGLAFFILCTVLFTGWFRRDGGLIATFFFLSLIFLFFLYYSGVLQYLLPSFTYEWWFLPLFTMLTLVPASILTVLAIHRNRRLAPAGSDYGKEEQLSDLSSIRLSIVQQISHHFRFPLETILAASARLEYQQSDPSITASAQVIRKEITELKRVLDQHTITTPGKISEDNQRKEVIGTDWETSEKYGRVCLFSRDEAFSSHIAFILRTGHFEVSITEDYYQILSETAENNFDVLLIHPASVGEKAFKLCNLVRAEHNMMDIPILMIAFPNRESLIKAGHLAGVNDFVAAPFDGNELITRVSTLVKLREIAHNNKDLAQSEKEKNIFLYFLTHNVNTPLTLLINRIRELEDFLPNEELDELVEDLRETSREINDIVQNVLISFRLADGRHTLFTEQTDLHSLLLSVEKEIRMKCLPKRQELTLELPAEKPTVYVDGASVKGCLYNIIDNAVKFTPVGGRIVVELIVTDHGTVNLEVRDTGPGIPADEEDRLFQRFETLSPRPTDGESSTGLGLYVAHELIKMNGGTLKYRPYPEGACFTVTFPVYQYEEK